MTSVETLISTMDCNDYVSLYKKMNIQTDAIIINQGVENYYSETKIDGNKIRFFSFKEKGVGLSRNNALMRSTADICIMSDDDMVYVDNYVEIVKQEYKKNSSADMIVFNVIIKKDSEEKNSVVKNGRVRHYNCLRFGTVNFTFKRDSIIKNNIYFSLLFGGGAKYGSGEDSLFIWSILSRHLKVYSCNKTIGTVYNYKSSWFKGYDSSYFYDRGVLFKALMPNNYRIMILQFLIRHKKLYRINSFKFRDVYKIMLKGAKSF